jgi:hypothetical protein
VTGRGHHGRRQHGGAGGHSSPADHVLWGRGRGHEGGGEGALGKKIKGGAHPNSGASVGRRSVVAFDGGEAASVVTDDGALALHHGGERER